MKNNKTKKLCLWLKTKLFRHCPKCGIKRVHKNFIKGDICSNRNCDWVYKKEEIEKELGKRILIQFLKDSGKLIGNNYEKI